MVSFGNFGLFRFGNFLLMKVRFEAGGGKEWDSLVGESFVFFL